MMMENERERARREGKREGRRRANMKKRGWVLVNFVRKYGDVDYSAAKVAVLSRSR